MSLLIAGEENILSAILGDEDDFAMDFDDDETGYADNAAGALSSMGGKGKACHAAQRIFPPPM